MMPSSVEKLSTRVQAMSVGSEEELLEFVALAARLAVLGRPEHLVRWRGLCKELKVDFAAALRKRFERGILQLDEAHGEELAAAVVAAQDFACFLKQEGAILQAPTRSDLEFWIMEAEDAALDEDAVEAIDIFRGRFPIPEEDRLDVIDAPLSMLMKEILLAASLGALAVDIQWPAMLVPELQCLASSQPPPELVDAFECMNLGTDQARFGDIRISRRLKEDWSILIDVSGSDADIDLVETITWGSRSARAAARPGLWVVDLGELDPEAKSQALCDSLVLRFKDGSTLRFYAPKPDSTKPA